MAIDFDVEPEFQEQIDWVEAFVTEEVEPLDYYIAGGVDAAATVSVKRRGTRSACTSLPYKTVSKSRGCGASTSARSSAALVSDKSSSACSTRCWVGHRWAPPSSAAQLPTRETWS